MRLHCFSPLKVLPVDSGLDYGPGTDRPIGMTHDEQDTNLFRRKTLRVHGNIIASFDGVTRTYSFDFLLDSQMNLSADLEKAPLHGLYGFDASHSASITSDDLGATFTVDFSLRVGFGQTLDDRIVKDGLTRHVPLFFSVEIGDILTYTIESPTPSAATLTLNGASISLFEFFAGSVLSGGTIAIDAPPTDGFFEYRKEDGTSPIYDPDTGEPL